MKINSDCLIWQCMGKLRLGTVFFKIFLNLFFLNRPEINTLHKFVTYFKKWITYFIFSEIWFAQIFMMRDLNLCFFYHCSTIPKRLWFSIRYLCIPILCSFFTCSITYLFCANTRSQFLYYLLFIGVAPVSRDLIDLIRCLCPFFIFIVWDN